MEETGQTEKTLQHTEDTAHTVTRKVEEMEMESPLTYRIEEDQKFQFIQEIKEDFKCPICKDILLRPLEKCVNIISVGDVLNRPFNVMVSD